MAYVDDAFEKLRQSLEITQTERDLASRRHREIRDHVRAEWDLAADFLTGSYDRETKTKPLKDVDIFIVIDADGGQAELRQQNPSRVLEQLRELLVRSYSDVRNDGFACTVRFGAEEDIASFDIVPAFKRDGAGYEIPDVRRGCWIATDPTVHAEMTTAKNKSCDGKFVPFLKMIKGMNRQFDEEIKPPFLLEVIGYELVKPPFGNYQDEVRWFLASAVDRISEQWLDPAKIGPDVNGTWDDSDRLQAREALAKWLDIAERAIRLEDDGQERQAVEEWRRLFGSRMPRP